MLTKLTLIPAVKAFADVVDAIHQLPTDAEGVAAVLQARGIKGHRGSAQSCALAVYAKSVIGVDHKARVRVGPVWMTFSWGKFELSHEIPDHLKAFTRRFDYREWPDLVAGNE